MLRLIPALLFVVITTSTSAQKITLMFGDAEQKYTLTFDPLKISENEVRRIVALSPYTEDEGPFTTGIEVNNDVRDKVIIAPRLERCIDNDSRYRSCGTRDLHDPHYFASAEINIQEAERQLSVLDNGRYPKQLEPVVKHLRRSLSFSLWIEQTRLEYYKTWDIEVLRRGYGNFEPAISCAKIFRQLDSAASRDEKYFLVSFGWYNCVLDGTRSQFGRYPMEAWREFLTDFGIDEQYTEDFPD
jgi:hypothetical protein